MSGSVAPRSSARSSPATWPTTTAVPCTRGAAASKPTTRSSAATSSTGPAARSARPWRSSSGANATPDGNTTDGDGGAIYTDEDGDVTVIDSTVSGSTADGPGGAIFTLDGDVTVIGSTLSGNRADDRGGAISGEASVTVINSTISRNLAVAHVGGGVWSRGECTWPTRRSATTMPRPRAAACTPRRPHARQLHRRRQRRVGGGQHRRRGAARGVRSVIGPAKLDFNGGRRNRPTTTATRRLDLARLQRRDRHDVRPGRAHRSRRLPRPGTAAPLRRPAETRPPQAQARRSTGCPPTPASTRRSRAARGRAAPRRARGRPRALLRPTSAACRAPKGRPVTPARWR